MTLALLVHEWSQKNDCKFLAITIDHGLRASSDTEAEQVHKWCVERGDHLLDVLLNP